MLFGVLLQEGYEQSDVKTLLISEVFRLSALVWLFFSLQLPLALLCFFECVHGMALPLVAVVFKAAGTINQRPVASDFRVGPGARNAGRFAWFPSCNRDIAWDCRLVVPVVS